MANEIYHANDVQLRQQIKAHLDEADALITTNANDITALEAADVVIEGRLDDLEGYRPGYMQYDGSTGYYNGSYTSSGNKVTAIARFDTGTKTSTQRVLFVYGPGGAVRITFALAASNDGTIPNKLVVAVPNSGGTNIWRAVSNDELAGAGPHTVFASFDGDLGTATLVIDGDNAAYTNTTAPTTGTLDSGASTNIYVGEVSTIGEKVDGQIGFIGFRDAYLTNWSDFMEADGSPKDIEETLSTVWGGTPAVWNPHGQLDRNLGSADNLTKNGTVTLYLQGYEDAWTEPDENLDSRLTVIEPISGTFTPTLQDASASDAESQTYTEQTGIYRKIDDMVWFWIDMTMSSLGTLSGNLRISGLPFTPVASSAFGAASVNFASGLNMGAAYGLTALVISGSNRIDINKFSATSGTEILTAAECTSTARFVLSGFYLT